MNQQEHEPLTQIPGLVRSYVRAHITDDEWGAYHFGNVSPATKRRIDTHLQSCFVCRHEYQMMQEDLAPAEVSAPRPVTRWDEARTWLKDKAETMLGGLHWSVWSMTEGWAGASDAVDFTLGQPDDELQITLSLDDETQELVAECYTTRLALLGAVLSLRVGARSLKGVFYECDEAELCAEISLGTPQDEASILRYESLKLLPDLRETDATPELLAQLKAMFASPRRKEREAALRVAAKLRLVATQPATRAALAELEA